MTTTTPSETVTTTSPAGAADAMMPITVTHLILIVLAIAATIAMIWWGRKLKQRRDAGEDDLEERGAIERVGEEQPVAEPDAAPPSERGPPPPPERSVPPPAERAAPPPAPPVPPLAPAPPPLADAEVPGAAPAPMASDLTTLKGLGPKVAAQLQALGVASIADLAALTPERAAAIDAELGPFQGRMARDRWVEQARLLTAGDRAGYEAMFGKLGG